MMYAQIQLTHQYPHFYFDPLGMYQHFIPMTNIKTPVRQANQAKRPSQHKGLGFLDIAVGISTLIASAASAGTNIYGVVAGMDLQKKQFALEKDIMQSKLSMEQQLFDSQKRLVDIQTSGIQARQTIDLEVAKSSAELEKIRIERQKQIEQARKELELAQIQKNPELLLQNQDFAPIANAYENNQQQSKPEGSIILPLAAFLLAIFGGVKLLRQ